MVSDTLLPRLGRREQTKDPRVEDMTPRVRDTIRELFPTNGEGLLEDLLRCGRGLRHARSALMYDRILRYADDDPNRVTVLVDWVLADEASFDSYLRRRSCWSSSFRRYSTSPDPDVSSAASIIRDIAVRAAEYACLPMPAHYTIRIFTDVLDSSVAREAKLFIRPMTGGAVYVSQDARLAEDGPAEAARKCSGLLLAGRAAAENILERIDRNFEHDCVPPNAK